MTKAQRIFENTYLINCTIIIILSLWEFLKLLDTNKVSSEGATVKGVAGRIFTDKSTGASLFLPAVGCRYNDNGTLRGAGSIGYYWSSTQGYSSFAYYLSFSGGPAVSYSDFRTLGFSVRCVAE